MDLHVFGISSAMNEGGKGFGRGESPPRSLGGSS